MSNVWPEKRECGILPSKFQTEKGTALGTESGGREGPKQKAKPPFIFPTVLEPKTPADPSSVKTSVGKLGSGESKIPIAGVPRDRKSFYHARLFWVPVLEGIPTSVTKSSPERTLLNLMPPSNPGRTPPVQTGPVHLGFPESGSTSSQRAIGSAFVTYNISCFIDTKIYI